MQRTSPTRCTLHNIYTPRANMCAILVLLVVYVCKGGGCPCGRCRPLSVRIGGGAWVRPLPRELAWCGSVFTPPPSPPQPDWELAAWMREHCAGPLVNRFYNRAAWRALRSRVLAETHGASLYELSQSPSRYAPARYVHHVMRVHEHPEWALSEWATLPDGRVIRNLMPLSFDGHEVAHGRACHGHVPRDGSRQITKERW